MCKTLRIDVVNGIIIPEMKATFKCQWFERETYLLVLKLGRTKCTNSTSNSAMGDQLIEHI